MDSINIIFGGLWEMKDDIECIISLLDNLERFYELNGNIEMRYDIKLFRLVLQSIELKNAQIANELEIVLK